MTLVSGSMVPSTHHGLLVDRNDSLDASINRMPAESVVRKVNLAILYALKHLDLNNDQDVVQNHIVASLSLSHIHARFEH